MPFFNMKTFDTIHTLLQSGEVKLAIEKMKSWESVHLAYFNDHYPNHLEVFKSSDFEKFWQAQREAIRIPSAPEFQYVHQPNLSDAEFVLGSTYYLLACKYKNEPIQQQKYLAKALELHSIHAANDILSQSMTSSRADRLHFCQNLAQIIHLIEPYIQVHQAPGFILLAKGYVRLALVARNDHDLAKHKVGFEYAYKLLYLAKLTEQASKNAIHNAYFGEGLKLASAFDTNDIDSMIKACVENSEGVLKLNLRRFLEQQAERELEKIMQQSSASESLTL